MIKCCNRRRPIHSSCDCQPIFIFSDGNRRGLGLGLAEDKTLRLGLGMGMGMGLGLRLGPSRSLISVEKGAAKDMHQTTEHKKTK